MHTKIDRIVDSRREQDGSFCYLVRWHETWEDEYNLKPLYQQLIDDYWSTKKMDFRENLSNINRSEDSRVTEFFEKAESSLRNRRCLQPRSCFDKLPKEVSKILPENSEALSDEPSQQKFNRIDNRLNCYQDKLSDSRSVQRAASPPPVFVIASDSAHGGVNASVNEIERSLTGSKYALKADAYDASCSTTLVDVNGGSVAIAGGDAALCESRQIADDLDSSISDCHYSGPCDNSNRVACGLCGDLFTDMNLLLRHCERAHGSGIGSPVSERLDSPARRVVPPSPDARSEDGSLVDNFQCRTCDKSELDKGEFLAHVKTHASSDGGNACSCPVCGKRCSHQGTLAMHMRHSHRGFGDVEGDQPGLAEDVTMVPPSGNASSYELKNEPIYSSVEEDSAHVSVSTSGDAASTCKICGKFCGHKGGLTMHMRHTHGSERMEGVVDRPVPVHTEDGEISRAPRYSFDMRDFDKQLACYICGKLCAHKGTLAMHMRLKHFVNDEQPFPITKQDGVDPAEHPDGSSCPVCGKYCGHKGGLTMHLRYMHGLVSSPTADDALIPVAYFEQEDGGARCTPPPPASEKTLECGICGKKVTHANNLKSHMKVHGYGDVDADAKCTICDRQFMHKGNLTLHMRKHALKSDVRQKREPAKKDVSNLVIDGPVKRKHGVVEEPADAKPSDSAWLARDTTASPLQAPFGDDGFDDRRLAVAPGRVNYAGGFRSSSSASGLSLGSGLSEGDVLVHFASDANCYMPAVSIEVSLAAQSGYNSTLSRSFTSFSPSEATIGARGGHTRPANHKIYSPKQRRQHKSGGNRRLSLNARFGPSVQLIGDGYSASPAEPADVDVRSASGGLPLESAILRESRADSSNLVSHTTMAGRETEMTEYQDPSQTAKPDQVKPFKCGICGKGFRLRGQLRIHDRVHSKEKPYTCEFCGKSFSQRSSMNTHVKSFHT